MRKSRYRCKIQDKKRLVELVLSGYRIEYIARTEGLHPETLRRWMHEYRDEVEAEMAKRKQQEVVDAAEKALTQSDDVQKKYNQAMKLLGEKELENAILRDLLKKTNPAALKDLK